MLLFEMYPIKKVHLLRKYINPEIVTPQNIMRETVSEANMEVVNAIYAIGNQITKAVDDKDMDVYMDADKVTRQVTKRQDTIKRQQGTSLVTI